MSFPAKYPGFCKTCNGRINIGDEIEWKAGEGAQHEGCHPKNKPTDFSGIMAMNTRWMAEQLARGWQPEPLPSENVTNLAAYEANASMGIYWEQGRGFYGKGFDEITN